MNTSTKIGLSVGAAIVVSLICYGLAGLSGCIFGFIGTLLIIGLFTIWKKYTYLIYCLIGMYLILSYCYFLNTFGITFPNGFWKLDSITCLFACGTLPLVVLMLIFYRKRAG